MKKTFNRVLLLTTFKTKAIKQFVKELEKANPKLKVTLAVYQELDFKLKTGRSVITLHESGEDIASFDMVHFKTTVRHIDIAAAAARYLDKRKTSFASKAIMNFPSASKLYQYVILSDSNIAVPNTLFILPDCLEEAFSTFQDSLKLPFILKDVNGSKGNFNYLINNQADFVNATREASENKIRLLGQTFIPNEGDYRILVLDQQIDLVLFRKRARGTHVNNTSKGASSKLVNKNDLPKKVQADSLKAAKLLDREIAGVDMVQDSKSGDWYCFEVNDEPQIATGSFPDTKAIVFANFLERFMSK